MVLQVRFPKLKNTIPWIEALLPKFYKARKVKFQKYLREGEATKLAKLSRGAILKRLSTHKEGHAFIWNGDLYLHPDAVIILVRSRMRSVIRRELKNLR